jgi:putative DNA primase/helicase
MISQNSDTRPTHRKYFDPKGSARRIVAVPDERAAVLLLPDVTGLPPRVAALAYAAAGLFVLPTNPADIKNPGSVVGGRWHTKSSRDPKRIRRWWRENPAYGIALHVGRSGLVLFDLDINDAAQLPADLWVALQCGRIQHTRLGESVRGHYVFACEPGEFSNSAGGFMRYGDVRGRNGVIIAEPTPHADGGQYRWINHGPFAPLPTLLRALLSAGVDHEDPMTPAALEAFLAAHTGSDRPQALKGQLAKFAADISQGGSRHDAMCAAMVWAFREAIAGCYPAQNAYDELRTAFEAAKPERGPGEFDRIAQWAAAQAEIAEPDQTRARLDRHLWPGPHAPQRVAETVAERAAIDGRPLAFWREQWLRWNGVYWEFTGTTALRKMLYDLLRDAFYAGKKDDERLVWNPDKSKIDRVVDALKSIVFLGNDVQAQMWLRGRGDRVIACRNYLVRVSDRKSLPHSDNYFNTFALPFDYNPRAVCPRWRKFVAELFPDTESAEALAEWFGYVLSGRTDLQKMLMLIGPTRSGKGTIDKVLSALVGTGHTGLSANDLKGDFGLQTLLDKTLAVFSDERLTVDGKRFVETLLRITGEDTVTINIKFQQPWKGRLNARLMFMSNELPLLPDSSGAIVGRMLMLRITQSWLGREDETLADAVLGELPGILNWALDGLDRLNARGRFQQPRAATGLIDLLHEGASPVTQFVGALAALGQDRSVLKADFYDAWKQWCADNGHQPGSPEHLSRKLFAAYPEKITAAKRGGSGKQRPHYLGVALRAERRGVKYRHGSAK